MNGSPAPASDAEITERLREILASEEFAPRATDQFGLWLLGLDEKMSDWLGSLGEWADVLAFVAVMVALAALTWLVYKLVDARWIKLGQSSGESRSVEAGPASPASLLDRARALADAGALRDAARALQAAVLQAACRQRQLVWRPALSDWEWLALLSPSADVIALTRSTERLSFGPQPTRAAFDACERTARALLLAAEVGSQ